MARYSLVPQGNEPSTQQHYTCTFALWSARLGLLPLKIATFMACFLAPFVASPLKSPNWTFAIMTASRQRLQVTDFSASVDNCYPQWRSEIVSATANSRVKYYISLDFCLRPLTVINETTTLEINIAEQLFPLMAPCYHHQQCCYRHRPTHVLCRTKASPIDFWPLDCASSTPIFLYPKWSITALPSHFTSTSTFAVCHALLGCLQEWNSFRIEASWQN